jgi:predicted GNAT family acetyltransferase
VARIGPVFTPRERRGRGYASAAVAQVTRLVLDQGARACLFTDRANPTSNKIYAALGYRPVVDMVNVVLR